MPGEHLITMVEKFSEQSKVYKPAQGGELMKKCKNRDVDVYLKYVRIVRTFDDQNGMVISWYERKSYTYYRRSG